MMLIKPGVKSHAVPFQCPVSAVLTFSQELLDHTIKVYLAVIMSCHVDLNATVVAQQTHASWFMKGVIWGSVII